MINWCLIDSPHPVPKTKTGGKKHYTRQKIEWTALNIWMILVSVAFVAQCPGIKLFPFIVCTRSRAKKKYRSYNQMHNILNAAELSVVFSLFTRYVRFFFPCNLECISLEISKSWKLTKTTNNKSILKYYLGRKWKRNGQIPRVWKIAKIIRPRSTIVNN